MADAPRILVMGIGNLLWADEGFGVRAVETLNARYAFPENVTLMDGGTQGLYLVNFVQEADRLLVFDAVDYGLEPGSIKSVWNEEVPKFTGVKKMSLHQTGFQEVLSAAELLGNGFPTEMQLIGVQAQNLEDWGGPVTPVVRSKMDTVLNMALETLAGWGATGVRRSSEGQSKLLVHGLEDDRYEAERPGDDIVYRHGDARFVF
ncbi:HyaD/HybD family hydrogenase maturation endopeptidase [Ponticaulis sp.]|uniref:HyaD/HybD family hydrogenase maturation endopeptidase n=1 Tax=Ponticaulis sp. TaxID=2020902 RepID=UPI000C5418D6|nr:HyaD/HybD family hydrogenase maturation endopeptidase [Ponticaulis sp.]MAF59099.1 HyaD/HybD family hydrogenase maturation endopeptidase [Ponticaulis sp.]MBN03041.1 HyaD/HybD family hydrogenase maturation endopeptidase [Ponticaulis sp.]